MKLQIHQFPLGPVFKCFQKMLFWGERMQKYWLQSSKSLQKDMNQFLSTRRLLHILVQGYHSSWWRNRLISVLWGLFSWFRLKMMFWEGSMQKYWFWSSKSFEKDMYQFLPTRRLLFIFGTRLSFILMKQRTHQFSLGPVCIFSYINVVYRS